MVKKEEHIDNIQTIDAKLPDVPEPVDMSSNSESESNDGQVQLNIPSDEEVTIPVSAPPHTVLAEEKLHKLNEKLEDNDKNIGNFIVYFIISYITTYNFYKTKNIGFSNIFLTEF